ncbi:Uncharacterised protein [Bordetella pertussis]|nr:Uncharacterised protein [Bordetella pertussis]
MELQQVGRHVVQHRLDLVGPRVDEQGHHIDEGWHLAAQLRRAGRIDMALAGRIEHEADGIGASLDGAGDVLFAGQPADLDACTHDYRATYLNAAPGSELSSP